MKLSAFIVLFALLGLTRINGADLCTSVFGSAALRTVSVTTSSGLSAALSGALAGDLIILASGTYNTATTTGTFSISSKSGTSANKIVLCGPPDAIVQSGSQASNGGFAFSLSSSSYWVFYGFSVTNSRRGFSGTASSNNIWYNVSVTAIAQQAFILQGGSASNTIRNSVISNIGSLGASNGKGVYLGGATSPDASNNNVITGNSFSSIAGESVDSRAETQGTQIISNTFNGGSTTAEQIIALRGTNALVKDNTITNLNGGTTTTTRYGAKTFTSGGVGGSNTVFDDNSISYTVVSSSSSAGIFISSISGTNNVVYCNNVVSPSTVLVAATGGSNTPFACTAVPTPAPTSAPASCSSLYGASALRTINVADATQLDNALSAALPGDLIVLASGTYSNAVGFKVTSASGTSANPIVLCGPSSAVVTTGTSSSGFAFTISSSDHWIFHGFEVSTARRAFSATTSSFNVFSNLNVNNIGNQAFYLQTNSSNNTVQNSVISNLGGQSASNGKGVYIGGGTAPDSSNNNVVQGNSFSLVTAEHVDYRDGTSGTQIINNSFDGAGTSVEQIIASRGTNGLIQGNTITNSARYGAKTFTPGGTNNVYDDNLFSNVPSNGAGVYISSTVGTNNVVYCNNVVDPPTAPLALSGGDNIFTCTAV